MYGLRGESTAGVFIADKLSKGRTSKVMEVQGLNEPYRYGANRLGDSTGIKSEAYAVDASGWDGEEDHRVGGQETVLMAITDKPFECPSCQTTQEVYLTSRAPWNKKLRALLGVPVHRCICCHRGFSEPEVREIFLRGQRIEVSSTFLRPTDGKGVDEVMREIAEAEQSKNKRRAEKMTSHKHDPAGELESAEFKPPFSRH